MDCGSDLLLLQKGLNLMLDVRGPCNLMLLILDLDGLLSILDRQPFSQIRPLDLPLHLSLFQIRSILVLILLKLLIHNNVLILSHQP